jgi:hypothetical protein
MRYRTDASSAAQVALKGWSKRCRTLSALRFDNLQSIANCISELYEPEFVLEIALFTRCQPRSRPGTRHLADCSQNCSSLSPTCIDLNDEMEIGDVQMGLQRAAKAGSFMTVDRDDRIAVVVIV